MYIVPGQGLTIPWGFWCQQEHLVTSVIFCKFKKNNFEVWFMQFVSWFYTCRGRQLPRGQSFYARGQKFDVNRKALPLYQFVASFKEISLKSDFIQFFHDLIYVYSPGAGGIQPPWDEVLMSTETSCHFDHLLLVSNHRWQWFLKNPLFYLFPIHKTKFGKIGQGQPNVIICIHVNPPWSSGRLPEMSPKISSKTYHFFPDLEISLIWIKNFPIYSIHFL